MPIVDVSILMTCHNKEEYLNEAIESILRQTYQPKEIILIHDQCNEPMHHTAVTSIMLPKNVGVCKARDIAFKYSTGHFVLFFDADDVMSPDYIEKMIVLDADIAYPDMFLWYVHGKYSGENKLVSTPEITPQNMHHHCQIPVTSLITRKVYETLGGFRNYEIYEDWDFWMRAMIHGFKFKKAQVLLWYRQLHGTRNRKDMEIRKQVYFKIQGMYEIKRGKLCEKRQ